MSVLRCNLSQPTPLPCTTMKQRRKRFDFSGEANVVPEALKETQTFQQLARQFKHHRNHISQQKQQVRETP